MGAPFVPQQARAVAAERDQSMPPYLDVGVPDSWLTEYEHDIGPALSSTLVQLTRARVTFLMVLVVADCTNGHPSVALVSGTRAQVPAIATPAGSSLPLLTLPTVTVARQR